jgi:cytochrome c5
MTPRPSPWVAATLTFVTIAAGAVPAQRDDPGERVMNASCLACHDVRRIQVQAMDAEQWEETLNAMLNEGAPLSDDAFPIVHAYLSRYFGTN